MEIVVEEEADSAVAAGAEGEEAEAAATAEGAAAASAVLSNQSPLRSERSTTLLSPTPAGAVRASPKSTASSSLSRAQSRARAQGSKSPESLTVSRPERS